MCPTSSATYALLARSLGEDDRAGALAALGHVVADPAIVATMRRHHLIPMLWATVPETELREHLPAEVFSRCRDSMGRPRPSPEDNLRVLDEVQRAFAGDGIDCMLLKGVYFAHRLYRGLERRARRTCQQSVVLPGLSRIAHALLALASAA